MSYLESALAVWAKFNVVTVDDFAEQSTGYGINGVAPIPSPRTQPSWSDVADLRWGPAIGDTEPGLVVDSHDPARLAAAFAAADPNDPYAIAEREAIQAESRESEASR